MGRILVSINILYHKLHALYPQLPHRYFSNSIHFLNPQLKRDGNSRVVIPAIPYPYYHYSYYFFISFYNKEEEG